MSLKKHFKRPRTIAFRLTVWYTGIFFFLSLGVFSLLYYLVHSYTYQRVDDWFIAEVEECRVMAQTDGLEKLKDDISAEESEIGDDRVFFRLVTPDGREIATSNLSAWRNFKLEKTMLSRVNDSEPIFETVLIEGDRYPTRTIQTFIAPGIIFQMGQNLKAEEEFLKTLKRLFSHVFVLAALLSIGFGWFMAKRALTGVETVTKTAMIISRSTLDKRVPVKGTDDEIDRLALTFNSMLERIQTLITGMKEINENIAHELRSPITRIRGAAEMALSGKTSSDELKTVIADTVEGCDQLLAMINTMLDISEMDAGIEKPDFTVVDISGMIKNAGELFQPVAEENRIDLSIQFSGPIQIRGDIKKLQRAVANLIDNALKHTPAGGTVRVSAEAANDRIRIIVRDTGPGIPPDKLPHIFNRFYRGDEKSVSGSGLGLSLAQAIVRFHGGNISVKSSPGKGSIFTITLPRGILL